MELEGC